MEIKLNDSNMYYVINKGIWIKCNDCNWKYIKRYIKKHKCWKVIQIIEEPVWLKN